jgi:hypothetical protein
MRAEIAEGERTLRVPIRASFFDWCCAAETGGSKTASSRHVRIVLVVFAFT